MSRQSTRPQSLLSRFWAFMLTTSEAAVAIHYDKPWHDDVPAKDERTKSEKAEIDTHEAMAA